MRCVPVNSIKVWDYQKIKLIEIRDLIRADFFTHSPKSNDVNSSISKRLNFQHNLFLSYSYCELLGATTKDGTFWRWSQRFPNFHAKSILSSSWSMSHGVKFSKSINTHTTQSCTSKILVIPFFILMGWKNIKNSLGWNNWNFWLHQKSATVTFTNTIRPFNQSEWV